MSATEALPLNSAILDKTRELCALILESPDYAASMEKVEAFEKDDKAKSQFQEFMKLGDSLHQKQHAGELTQADVEGYEAMQKSLRDNPLIDGFMSAEQDLNAIAKQVSMYVGKSLEMGRVPEPEDLDSGCCSSGGCGC